MPAIQHDHGYHLLSRLRRQVPDLAAAPLLSYYTEPMTLGVDPHPNAATARVMAGLVAQALFDQGLVDRGAGHPLPEVPPEYRAVLAPPLTPEAVDAMVALRHAKALEALRPCVDFTTGHGIAQIIGGVSENGLVGPRALLLLARAGETLDIEFLPIAERPGPLPARRRSAGRRHAPRYRDPHRDRSGPRTAAAAASRRSCAGRSEARRPELGGGPQRQHLRGRRLPSGAPLHPLTI